MLVSVDLCLGGRLAACRDVTGVKSLLTAAAGDRVFIDSSKQQSKQNVRTASNYDRDTITIWRAIIKIHTVISACLSASARAFMLPH